MLFFDRENEIELLLKIRNGKIKEKEFAELILELDNKFNLAAENTKLPDKPNYNEIENFVMKINEKIVKKEI